MDAAMRASQITRPAYPQKGKLISFCESTLNEQRAYVWNHIAYQTCLYVDWNGDISRYNRPPPLPYTVHISEQDHIRLISILTSLCSNMDTHVLVFDPFISIQNQKMAPLFCTIARLAHTKNITVFFMLASMQAPIIQAEVYIDPRR